METFLKMLAELGYGDDPPARALAQRLWDISQRIDRTTEEQALVTWFRKRLEVVRSLS